MAIWSFITVTLKLCRLQESPFDGVWPRPRERGRTLTELRKSDTGRIWDATLKRLTAPEHDDTQSGALRPGEACTRGSFHLLCWGWWWALRDSNPGPTD